MSRYRLLNETAYLALGLTWSSLALALAGIVPLATGGGLIYIAIGAAGALLGLALLTTIRWLERRNG